MLAGVGLRRGSISLAIAAATVTVVLIVALRYGRFVERFVHSDSDEVLLLKVLGLTVLVAGVAQELQVSAAVGAFLVGIALSGPLAHTARDLLNPLTRPVRGGLLRVLRPADRPDRPAAGGRNRAWPWPSPESSPRSLTGWSPRAGPAWGWRPDSAPAPR